jgi:hypothetical protein
MVHSFAREASAVLLLPRRCTSRSRHIPFRADPDKVEVTGQNWSARWARRPQRSS